MDIPKNNYQWQGEPVKVEFGQCIVTPNDDKPLFWYNYECSLNDSNFATLIPAIKITYNDESFCIANEFGEGIHKLLNGGWSNSGHASLPLEGFRHNQPGTKEIVELDQIGYRKRENERCEWQEKNHPEEFAKSEALREMIQKSPLYGK